MRTSYSSLTKQLLAIARATLLAASVVWGAAACQEDATGVSRASVRFLAVQTASTYDVRLVEFEAPPLRVRRSMPLLTSDSTITILLRNGRGGGFYAIRSTAPYWWWDPNWELVRYDDDWHVAASVPGSVIMDTASLSGGGPHLSFSADRRYLVASLNDIPNGSDLAILDPATLAVVNRTGRWLWQYPMLGRATAAGPQILLGTGPADACPQALVWLDVSTGQTADSTNMPCGFFFVGAASHRRVYRFGHVGRPPDRLELYDLTSGTIVAVAPDSVAPGIPTSSITADGRLVLFGWRGATVLDPVTLSLVGIVSGNESPGDNRYPDYAIVDTANGAVIMETVFPISCLNCSPFSGGIRIFDPLSLSIIASQVFGVHTALVH